MRIMIVEDDTVTQVFLESTLTEQGFDTTVCGSVRDATVALDSGSALDLIILDINLPDKRGMDFLKELRRRRMFNKVPVLMCTATSDLQMVRECIHLGAAGYLVKPIDTTVLIDTVQSSLFRRLPPVLTVCRHATVLEILTQLLHIGGYETIVATTGESALEIIQSERATAVIADMDLPDMTGLDLLVQVKAHSMTLPILLFTDSKGVDEREAVLSNGADGFFGMPFSSQDIVRLLDQLLFVGIE